MLITLKNWKTGLDFIGKHLKQLGWEAAHDLKHTILSLKHGGACMAASVTLSLMFTDDAAADRSNRMNYKVRRAMRSAQNHQNL